MPITKSAKKALRGSLVKKAINDRNKKAVKESIKGIEKLLKEKKKDEAKKLLSIKQQKEEYLKRTPRPEKRLDYLRSQNNNKPSISIEGLLLFYCVTLLYVVII